MICLISGDKVSEEAMTSSSDCDLSHKFVGTHSLFLTDITRAMIQNLQLGTA